MVDFLMISTRSPKRGVVEIYPKFIIRPSTDLMIRGGDFYAIWIEEAGMWSTDEHDALRLIDRELDIFAKQNAGNFDGHVKVLHMWDAETGMIDSWHKFCQKQMRDSYHMLDEELIWANTSTKKEDYASKKLKYALEPGEMASYDKLISTLYSPEERHKIEWSIGSIVSGDSKKLQKFLVLYGSAGTGKSTILNIIQQLFDGYYSVFDAKALGSSNNSFALEAFKTNPLVAIQHDGDLSKIEDNTRLNSLVSHELMTVNEKFKSTYTNSFKCFLFMGTNKPVKITDAKSGLIRRLIDVTPTGNKLDQAEYKRIMHQLKFELGAIACHCRDVYLANPNYYDDYIPIAMMGASNDFYNFVVDSFYIFKKEDGVTLKAAWEMYKTYCDEAKVPYPFSQRTFKEELKNYFYEYRERYAMDDGTRVRSYYSGFRTDKFDDSSKNDISKPEPAVIKFEEAESIFDIECAECFAQYANDEGTPLKKWENVTTKLKDIDTSKLHYVKVPDENHIVIDFDIPDEHGNKCFEKNLEAASKWPPTYAELSKSGAGIHLHYIYAGDASRLSRIFEEHVEIKTFPGNSSIRRKLSKCNNLPIATINSGLPLKGDKKMVNFDTIQSEKGLRTIIRRCLAKEIHPNTKPNVDFIYKKLEEAYTSNMNYDITDMRNAVLAFAASSTNQSDYCIKLVNKMKFKSEETSDSISSNDDRIIFYDVEVFPNLFVVCWKIRGEDNPVVRMINPSMDEIMDLMKYNLVGFNCRRYDNHILYAASMGYSVEQLFNLSQKIINKSPNCFFGEAYNVSYTDIYDFASAGNKMSLKKWEIKLGIHHQELGLPWEEPVDPEMWDKVTEYCTYDVLATEAVFEHLKGDWLARQILADLAGGTVNDTTNSLTTKFIFGKERHPQSQFNYRNLAEPVEWFDPASYDFLQNEGLMPKRFDEKSLLPYFPGYKYDHGKSTYRGEEVGEGGYVYAEPGMYTDVALLDVTSMHPHSVMTEVLFGPIYTKRFKDIVYGRVNIKREEWDEVNSMLNGALTKYVQLVIDGEMTSKELADALKTAINAVYGLTAASFENAFRDSRNIDNIVAKRGALFMMDLKYAVQEQGFTVAHIKTDSIKIPNATPEIIEFVMEFGKRYGYSFEHEATYDRMCLVNNAVYIAKYKGGKHDGEWTATGAQFAVPYVFKSLFTHEDLEFSDMCETKEVQSALYLDMNENLPDVTGFEKEHEKLWKRITDKSRVHENMNDECARIEELSEMVDKGHNYIFVGKVGSFCPMMEGAGGGILLREMSNKQTGEQSYAAVTGSKGYRWMEAEMVKTLGKEDLIDHDYYRELVNNAIETMAQYGDVEWFLN